MRTRRKRGARKVREWSDRQLHQVARMLQQRSFFEDNSEAQDWLFAQCVAELEWRRANVDKWWLACHCDLCVGPFE